MYTKETPFIRGPAHRADEMLVCTYLPVQGRGLCLGGTLPGSTGGQKEGDWLP